MNTVSFIFIAGALTFSFLSNAAITDKEYASCASIDGDLARLICFDAMAKDKKLDGPQKVTSNPGDTGKWEVSSKTNPIDDTTTVVLSLLADSGKSRYGESIFLIARCKEGSVDFYIGWQDFLGSDARVLTRVGKGKATTTDWTVSTDKKASFHPNPIGFLKSMEGEGSLIAQVTPYNESPSTAIFDISGYDEAIKVLRLICPF